MNLILRLSVWRSFNDTPFDMPLAMCLPDSVSDQEFCKVDLVGRERAGESWYLHHNPDQKWLWASDMKSSEVLAFVTWDSTYVPGEMKCKSTKYLRAQELMVLLTTSRQVPATQHSQIRFPAHWHKEKV
jgi:hypothetical protein